ncbi:MAG: 50S ribosomal protein L19 [Halobacteriovoraceae bacterium]|nr:50S ribosomal protein L19 [Halobacteriovoraceae bacterium]
MNLVDQINEKHLNENVKSFPDFRSGDTVAVHVKIVEGKRTRIQVFKGICIGVKAKGAYTGHFRVRKLSDGVGVERIFPFHSPNIDKIEVTSRGKTRRAKHYYLRDRKGKEARISVDFSREN